MTQTDFQYRARDLVRQWVETKDAAEFIERMDALIESGYDIDADPRNWRTLIDSVTATQFKMTATAAGYTEQGLSAMLFDMFGVRYMQEITVIDEDAVHCTVSNAEYARKFSVDRVQHARSWIDDISGATRAKWSDAAYERMLQNGNFSEHRI